MPTSRGWAGLGVSTALLVLWVGFGEIELMTTAMFLVAAVSTGTLFVRFASPRVEVVRRIYPLPVFRSWLVFHFALRSGKTWPDPFQQSRLRPCLERLGCS